MKPAGLFPMTILLAVLSVSAADSAPRKDLWSIKTITTPAIPSGKFQNPIDAFLASSLSGKKLTLSPAADRITLIRRVTFDLTGLPPTPQEIDNFLVSKSPRAFDDLVERLLASPHYGERWGRHWLDVARYTESQGFEYDRLRNNAWHYRDYVIKSFNEDKPYNQFMKEQIAGDAMLPLTRDGLVAVSLLVCGPWDQAGNSQANVTQRTITREEELEDLIAVVSQSFLGLTVNCARCHAHKFDPIPQEEYYRIKSVFEGVKHGERSLALPGEEKNKDVSYIGQRVQPEPTKRLKRGDVNSPLETVNPSALACVANLSADFGLAPDAPEAQRRLKFAEWLADPHNPLPARVMVNRVWQYHFGQGLVATPSDFGLNGARPSHPELLDFLAAKFIESGWSVKSLHRLILTSAAYQQQSRWNEKAAALDSDNQLLWRFAPRRLEAEELRDAMLTASGEINFQMGGPSFRPFKISSFNSDFYEPADVLGATYNRRTVYRMNVNSGKDPMLDSFDCPDPSVKTPRRGVTTTPLQALALMNDSFVQRQADRLAERALTESHNDTSRAIQIAYRLTLGRRPTPSELHDAVAAVRDRNFANLCWALLNSTEFLYVK